MPRIALRSSRLATILTRGFAEDLTRAALGPSNRRAAEFEEAFGAAVPYVIAGPMTQPAASAYLHTLAALLFPADDRAAFIAFAESRLAALTWPAAERYKIAREPYDIWRKSYVNSRRIGAIRSGGLMIDGRAR